MNWLKALLVHMENEDWYSSFYIRSYGHSNPTMKSGYLITLDGSNAPDNWWLFALYECPAMIWTKSPTIENKSTKCVQFTRGKRSTIVCMEKQIISTDLWHIHITNGFYSWYTVEKMDAFAHAPPIYAST